MAALWHKDCGLKAFPPFETTMTTIPKPSNESEKVEPSPSEDAFEDNVMPPDENLLVEPTSGRPSPDPIQ